MGEGDIRPSADLPQPPGDGADRRHAPAIGVVGFALSIPGLVLPFLGIVALVLSALGLAEARRLNLPRRLCLAGVVLGVLGCVVTLSIFVEWVLTP